MITLKASSKGSGVSITLPSQIAPGDLILLQASQLTSTYPGTTTPEDSGYTVVKQGAGSGTYGPAQKVWWKIAVSSDAGKSITINPGNTDYGGSLCLVVTGHDSSDPISYSSVASGSGTTASTGSILTSEPTQRFVFVATASDAIGPTAFATPSGYSSVENVYSSLLHASEVFRENSIAPAGSHSASVQTATTGGWVGVQVAIAEESTGWTVGPNVASSSSSVSVSTSSLDGEKSYEYQVRTRDGAGLWSPWSASETVNVTLDNPPTKPGPVTSPTEGQIVNQSVTVSWGASTDPDGDPITYYLYSYQNPHASFTSTTGTSVVVNTSAWPETTSAIIGIEAVANGKYAPLEYTPTFTVSHSAIPTITPVTATDIKFHTQSPSLDVRVTDADAGQTLTITYELAGNTLFIDSVTYTTTRSTPASNVLVSQSPPTALTDHTYYWRAKVSDGTFESGWTPTRYFTIDRGPSQPGAFTSPNAGDVINDFITLAWGASIDPDGDPITYHLAFGEVGTNPIYYDLGTTTETSMPVDTSLWPNMEGAFTVEAVADGKTSSSQISPTVEIYHPPPPPTATLLSPQDGATLSSGSAVAFSWEFSGDVSSTQSAFAFRRKRVEQ